MTDKAPSPKGTASVPKKKDKQDEAIIGTNDYSIVSKRSVEKLYQRDEPEFLRPFVGKFKRRAPLINRGYWLRMRAIEHVIKTFLDEPTSKSKIILNLGCGYEPLPFRMLWKYKTQCRNVKFIDIDFFQLMHQKVQIMHKNTLLTDLLHGSSGDTLQSESILLDDKHYSAIGCDLGDVARTRELFSMLQLQDYAVLFLAEVSMVYMKPDQATNLIKLCGELPDARFCMLEQHLPAGVDHPFAKTMVDHFNKQTPLRALNSYPTIDSQRMRFAICDWPEVRIRNLWSLWQDDAFVDHGTKCALDDFEPFDEWEEFAMFASHYFLLTATTHKAFKFSPLNLSGKSPDTHKLEFTREELSTHIQMLATPNPKAQGQRRFGAVFDVNKDSFAHHGGMVSMTRHTDSDVYTRSEELVDLVNPPESILCHTITTLHDGSVLFAGGRRSPASASATCYLRENGKWNKTHDLHPARYRHCSVAVTLGSRTGVLTFGGRTRQAHVLGEWQLYDRERGWKVVRSDSQVPGVFGAAMVATSCASGILLGGMTSSGTVLSHYLKWELVQEEDGALKVRCKYTWKPRPEGAGGCFVGLSRFGAQLVQTRWGLVLIGGIGPHGVLGADKEVIFIKSDGTIQHTTALSGLLTSGAPRPMLTGHSTKVMNNEEIIIIGGGGVCFSFGALWNDSHYILRSASSVDKATTWRLASADKASSVLQGGMEQLSLNSAPFECAENCPGTLLQALQHAQEITHVKISSPEDFQKLVLAAQPVILQSMDLGPCSSLWTPQYLKEKIGPDRAVIVHSSNEPHLSFLKKNFTYETQPFNTFIDAAMSGSHVYLRALSSENPSKLPAAIHRDFPTISDNFVLPTALKMAQDKEHSSVLRISGQTTMWLHYDVMANILCQVRGSKRVVLFPPADISLLKFVHGETTSSLNVFTTAEQLPKNVHPVESILNEGEVLFIPACWAHATAPAGEGGSVAINVFFKSFDDGAYAAGRDVYGNRDLGVYQNGRRDVERIIKAISNDCEGGKKERARCVVDTLRTDNRRERSHGDVHVKVQKEVVRILKSVEGLPEDIGKFYLNRLADELDDFAKTCSG